VIKIDFDFQNDFVDYSRHHHTKYNEDNQKKGSLQGRPPSLTIVISRVSSLPVLVAEVFLTVTELKILSCG